MKPLTLLLLCLACITGRAQQAENRFQSWYTYFGAYQFSGKWGLHFDAQMRLDNGFETVRQGLLRPGLQYYPTANTSLTLGYAFVNTFSDSRDRYGLEHRVWEQFIYKHRNAIFDMTHRFRLEQRFVARYTNNEVDGYNKGHRFRYFNRTLFPLSQQQPGKPFSYYAALQNELFFNFANRPININTFDQNRLYIALGLLLKKGTRIEAGYMNQYLHPATGRPINNHILQFSVLNNLRF